MRGIVATLHTPEKVHPMGKKVKRVFLSNNTRAHFSLFIAMGHLINNQYGRAGKWNLYPLHDAKSSTAKKRKYPNPKEYQESLVEAVPNHGIPPYAAGCELVQGFAER